MNRISPSSAVTANSAVMVSTLFSLGTLTMLLSLPVSAHEAGDIILRFGATQVSPDESSSVISSFYWKFKIISIRNYD